MTYREKLMRDHPEWVNDAIFIGGCKGCPSNYDYEEYEENCLLTADVQKRCRECWDREMEEER